MGQTQPRQFPRPGELQATNEAPRVVSPVQPTPYIPNPGVRSLLNNNPTPKVAAPNSTNTSTPYGGGGSIRPHYEGGDTGWLRFQKIRENSVY